MRQKEITFVNLNQESGKNKNAPNNLKYILNLYKSFARNTFEGICQTSFEGDLLLFNTSFVRILGYSNRREIRFHGIQDLFFDSSEWFKALRDVRMIKDRIQKIVEFKSKDGNKIVLLANIQTGVNYYGLHVINWTFIDMTENYEQQKMLLDSNKALSKINRQMERFLYCTSHDLRAPISSVLGLVNLIRMECDEAALHCYVNKIEQCMNKMDGVLNSLMDFAKSNYERFQTNHIDVEHWLTGLIDKLKAEHPEHDIQLNVQKTPFNFYCDINRLTVILSNILKNAVQFADPNKIRPFIHVQASVESSGLKVTIIDNGIGIGKGHLQKIFDMFYKATEKSPGSGLGLFIVKESIEQLKGTIKVESEYGIGSSFTIQIPNDRKGHLVNKKLLMSGPR